MQSEIINPTNEELLHIVNKLSKEILELRDEVKQLRVKIIQIDNRTKPYDARAALQDFEDGLRDGTISL